MSTQLPGPALVVTGKQLVPEEELAEPYPPNEHPLEQRLLVQSVDEAVDGITRRRLLSLRPIRFTRTR